MASFRACLGGPVALKSLVRCFLIASFATMAEGWAGLLPAGLSVRCRGSGGVGGRATYCRERWLSVSSLRMRAVEGNPSVTDEGDEFSALALPMEPNAALSPGDVMLCLVRGLKFNNIPKENAGLERCYNFADNMCRAAIGGDGGKSGSHQVSLENFIKYANNPTFASMCNCKSFSREPLNIIPGTETRGALATQVVRVTTASGQVRPFLWTLQQERRPPLTGAWLVKQCLYMNNAWSETV